MVGSLENDEPLHHTMFSNLFFYDYNFGLLLFWSVFMISKREIMILSSHGLNSPLIPFFFLSHAVPRGGSYFL